MAKADPRMVYGPVIANFIFFEVWGLHADGAGWVSAELRALPVQEVWLESTGESLEGLVGRLEVVATADPAAPVTARISREGVGYCVRVQAGALEALVTRLSAAAGATLMLEFDVEYDEGYESPGGYSAGYGVRYWDDVAYPVAEAARVEVGPAVEDEGG